MKPNIIPYDLGCEPSPSVSDEMLIASGWNTYLLFEIFRQTGIALIECESCVTAKLGYPNDEGLPEHPLYEFGMEKLKTDVMEVIDSPWSRELINQANKSSERIWGGRNMSYSEPKSENYRHFIIALKESTFECICSSLKLVRVFDKYSNAKQYAFEHLGE